MEADLSGLFISVCGAILLTVLHSLEHPVVIRRFAYILQQCDRSDCWSTGLS